ncbi:MAG: hypothetical protein AMXMBFR64_42980 [Myxococcales bacterium]
MTEKKATILITDDEPQVRQVLRRILEPRGYVCLEADCVATAKRHLAESSIALVLSDVSMPGETGLELVRHVRGTDTAIIMITALDNSTVAIEALVQGAYGYVIKPFEINEIVINVENALRRRTLEIDSRRTQEILEQRVREQTEEIRASREEIALRLIAASEYRDNETGGHIRRIGLYAAELGGLLGFSPTDVDLIRVAAPMHDVGKIGIPDAILQKPGKHTPDEWDIMMTHTRIGAEILGGTQIPLLNMARKIALCHHEKWDGGGYPQKLQGETIPVEARIVAIVDVYDALTHARVYKPAWPEPEAIAHLRSQAGAHFDPDLLDTFLENLGVMRDIRLSNPD